MSTSDETTRCPECRSTNLRFGGSREIFPPVRKGQPQPAERKAVAKMVQVRCGRCRNSWSVLRKLT